MSIFASRPQAARLALTRAGSNFRAARHLAFGLDCYDQPMPAEVAAEIRTAALMIADYNRRLARRAIREAWPIEWQDAYVEREVWAIAAQMKRPQQVQKAAA